jgi:hypothetical protein
MFDKSIKGQLNRNSRIKNNDLSGRAEYTETIVLFEKLPNGLAAGFADDLAFVLQRLHLIRIHNFTLSASVYKRVALYNKVEIVGMRSEPLSLIYSLSP